MSAPRPPAVALLVDAGLPLGARVDAPAELADALRVSGFSTSASPPLDAAILGREGQRDPESVSRAWRRLRPGGLLVLHGPGLLGRLRGRGPDVPAALAPAGEAKGWSAWRVPPLDELRPREGVVTRVIDAELFLVDLRSGATFRLNTAGRAVWDALIAGRPLAEAAAALPGAPPDRALADVTALVLDLADAGLLVAP